ncbi:hypothetical protein HPB49_019121 [Dermacentor silvarum]|uniref:Uncharacterized protein n=1 Tax=Dermacentor silvarum TaxID=543639 RepID=A0ACB8CAT5_DERSI|nr:hypothetical protein HPB49_019121 [Dermacentor silvarum]
MAQPSDQYEEEPAEADPAAPFHGSGYPATSDEEEESFAEETDLEEEQRVWYVDTFKVWAICCPLAAIITVPLGFLLMSGRAVSAAGQIICQRPTPTLPGNVTKVRATDFSQRVSNALGDDFLPMHLSFALCTNLIYWSVSLADSMVSSRQPKFDSAYGLAKLREISLRQTSTADNKLLMTLGGYPEDSVYFHHLGTDAVLRHRMVFHVLNQTARYHLNGTNIHWVKDYDFCETGFSYARWKTLGHFVSDIAALASLNHFDGPFYVTLMIDPFDRPDNAYLKELAGKVDLVFWNTHLIRPRRNSLPEYCGHTVKMVEQFVDEVSPLLVKNDNAGMCVSATVALQAWTSPTDASPLPAQAVSGMEGRVSVSEVCRLKSKILNMTADLNNGCYVYNTTDGGAKYFAYDTRTALKRKLTVNKQVTCVVLHDLDFDNFSTECGAYNHTFLMSSYFSDVATNRTAFDISEYFPPK